MPGQSKHRTPPFRFALYIGFYAGLIWGAVRWIAFEIRLTTVAPAFLADPWLPRDALAGLGWGLAGLAMFMLLSIAASLLYGLALGRLQGPWPGLLYGAAWGALVLLAGPWIGLIPPLPELGWGTIATEASFYAVWGLFIGYSIAFEFHDEAGREPAKGGGRRAESKPAQ